MTSWPDLGGRIGSDRARRRTGPCRSDHGSAARPSRHADLGGVAGVPRDAVAVAERHQADAWSVRRRSRSSPYETPAPGVDDLDVHELGPQPHHRSERDSGQGGDARCGIDPVRRDADPHQVEAGLAAATGRPRSWLRWRTLGVEPGGQRDPVRGSKATSWIMRPTDGPGSSAAARCDQTPTTSTRPDLLGLAARPRQTAGQSATVAPLRDSPVSILRWTRARRSAMSAAASDDRGDLLDRLGGDVDVGSHQRGEVVVRSVQPGQQPTAYPPASRSANASLRRGHPEPARPGRHEPPGRSAASRARTRPP